MSSCGSNLSAVIRRGKSLTSKPLFDQCLLIRNVNRAFLAKYETTQAFLWHELQIALIKMEGDNASLSTTHQSLCYWRHRPVRIYIMTTEMATQADERMPMKECHRI